MEIYKFIALPGQPCIRLKVGPGLDDYIEVDQLYYEGMKDELLQWCLDMPEVEGLSWRELRRYTEGNGLWAKLLIVLGDLCGAWRMHPPREGMGPWTSHTPRVASMVFVPPPRVLKPSAGDLDDTTVCFCCERPMGPVEDLTYDLYKSSEDSLLCVECAAMGCTEEKGPCRVFPEKIAGAKTSPKPEEDEEEFVPSPPSNLEAYLKGINE